MGFIRLNDNLRYGLDQSLAGLIKPKNWGAIKDE